MLSACWLIGAHFLAVSSYKRGRLNTSVYGNSMHSSREVVLEAVIMHKPNSHACAWKHLDPAKTILNTAHRPPFMNVPFVPFVADYEAEGRTP